MATPWKDVESSKDYIALPADQRRAAKQQYFDTVVAPQLSAQAIPLAKSQFFGEDVSTPALPKLTPAQEWAAKEAPDSAAMTMLQGVTFGAGDEIAGGAAALKTGLKNIGTRVMGGTPEFGMGEAYDAVRDQARMNYNKFPTDYPEGNQTGLEMLVGAAGPGAGAGKFIAKGATPALRMLRGAEVGAGFGAASGFAGGEGLKDRAEKAAWGVPFGAATGLTLGAGMEAAPVVGKGLKYLSGAAAQVFKKMVGMSPEDASRVIPPERLHELQEVAINYTKDLVKKSGKETRQLIDDPAHVQGKPVTAAEAIGPQGEAQLASIARRSGKTGSEAESQFRLRGEQRASRLQENLSKAARISTDESGKLAQTIDEQAEALRRANAPRYKKAYEQPPIRVEDNPYLQKAFSDELMSPAIKQAERKARNAGRPWNLKRAKEDGVWEGSLTWEDLDNIKRYAGAAISKKHTNALGEFQSDDLARLDLDVLGEYRNHLFETNLLYKEAVAHGGEPIVLEESFRNAKRLMDNKTSEYAFDKAINEMTPAQLEATKLGWVNDVYERLQAGKLQEKDLKTSVFLAKARRLLGETQARQFVDEAAQELRLKGAEQKIPPKMGSATMGLQAASEEADAALDEGLHRFGQNMVRRGMKPAILQAANDAVYQVLHAARTPEKEALRDEIGKLLLMKPDQLKAILEAPASSRVKTEKFTSKGKEFARMLYHLMTTGSAEVAGAATKASVGPLSQQVSEEFNQ
ncbi:MAG: hypothetical protein E6R03_07950 [Hyphomicrobiaceae bacterium]|nr:MAG: hypothetical protein E6R03_07950 [Hyphomicrobiaceae bacterium]